MLLKKYKNNGFTFIEIIVVLLTLSIIMSFSVVRFAKIVKSKKINAIAIDITDLFNYSKIKALSMNQNIFLCQAYIRSDSKLNNCIKNDNDNTNSFMAFTGNDSTYISKNDIKLIKIDNNNIKFNFYTFNPTEINNNIKFIKLNNPKLVFLPNNKLAIIKNGIISNIGNMVKITIQDKYYKKICSVIKIESSGKARICNKKDTQNINSSNFKICSCTNIIE